MTPSSAGVPPALRLLRPEGTIVISPACSEAKCRESNTNSPPVPEGRLRSSDPSRKFSRRLLPALALLLLAPLCALAQNRPAAAPAGPPPTPKAAAVTDLTGTWVSDIDDEWRWRIMGNIIKAREGFPADTYKRVLAFPNFAMHVCRTWTDARMEDGRIQIDTSRGRFFGSGAMQRLARAMSSGSAPQRSRRA